MHMYLRDIFTGIKKYQYFKDYILQTRFLDIVVTRNSAA